MKYRKRLNNNVVIAATEDGTESVLVGRGLGFSVTVGADVDMSRVERVFVLKTDSDSLPLPAEYLAVAEEIFAHAPSDDSC